MEDMHTFVITVFLGFFAIMNPFANVSIFLGLVDGLPAREKRIIAFHGVFTAFVIVAIFAVSGQFLFHAFGITLIAFRIAGGLLIFYVGFELLQGKTSAVHSPCDKSRPGQEPAFDKAALSLAVSPLAVPILAGPGTISTAMNFVAGGSALHIAVTLAVFAVMCLITWTLFVSGERVVRLLGQEFLIVISRMMGLVLTVMGTQMVIEGIKGALHSS